MAFVIQAHIEDHTLSATTETAKEAFAKAVEWQAVHKLTCVAISDGVRSFSITDFASAMAFLEIANTVGAPSDPRPKVLHVYLAAIGLDVLPGYAEDTTESTAAEPLVSGCRPISRRAAHLGRASERDVSWHMGQLRVGNPSGCPILRCAH